MAATTLYLLAEQAFNLIEGGDSAAASSLDLDTLKKSCGQVINKMLKITYFDINLKMGETIPNGTCFALYENIDVVGYAGNRSKATLPIKPISLPRGMGVYSVFRMSDPLNEFIPLQLGQHGLLRSQPMINDILGQVGYEVWGNESVMTKNLAQLFPGEKLGMRLAVLDMDKYGDYDPLPLPPEYEWDVLVEVYKLYTQQPVPDKIVEATSKERKNILPSEQKQ